MAIKAAKIDKQDRNLRPHSLRHSLATHLRGYGIDAAQIRAAMGWSSEAIQDNYTHWNEAHFKAQKKRVEELFG
jgi:integrase